MACQPTGRQQGSSCSVGWLGSLCAERLTAFVLRYRTSVPKADAPWQRPLEDSQRLMATVRARGSKWNLDPHRIGLLGFSAGGQVAARLLSQGDELVYAPIDAIDDHSPRPDFALLIYPWGIYDTKRDELVEGVRVTAKCPPTFLVHTHDDRSSSLGAVLFYAGLKRRDIASELHVYGNGGHGYGLRPVEGSEISSWPDHAEHFLSRLGVR